jgi:ABC-2 type transport system permease protein
VTGTFFYLTVRSLKNRLLRRFRRLREPRYLAGLVVGLVYLYWFVVRNQMRTARRSGAGLASLAPFASDIVAGGALILWVATLLVWLWPFASKTWSFSGAEVQFFFTAPVSRRQLLNYKLLRSQLGLLFGVLIASLFTGAALAAAAGRWSFLLGGWLLFATMYLHVLGANLTKASFRAPAAKVPWLAWVSAAAMVLVSGVVAGSYAVQASALMSRPLAEQLRAVVDVSRTGVTALALWPFNAIVAPLFALGPAAFARALAPALAVLAINYLWVLQSDAQLEAAAAAAEERKARGRRGVRAPVLRAAPFTLAPRGRLETAIFWKNIIQVGRYVSITTLIRVVLPIVALAFVIGLNRQAGSFAPVVLMVAVFLTMMGPYMFRNDLRMDMPRLPVLKTWPISGRELLLGELLAPAFVLSSAVWFLLAVAFALSRSWNVGPADTLSRGFVAISGALLAPMLIVGQLIIQNAAVVLFPGWVATGGARARGIEAMGQNMLMFAGTLLALALGVLPAATVAGGIGFLLYMFIGWPGVLPAAILFAGILTVEVGIVLTWLGRVLERTDPSQIEIAE